MSIRHIKRREPERGNQLIATLTPAEAARIRSEIARRRAQRRSEDGPEEGDAQSPYVADEVGVFYIIQLEPQFDPGRFKLGWAGDIEERLRKHRCVAPFAKCVKKWPCRRAWEQTAIHKVADGSERLHTEVFRAASLMEVVERAEAFFSMMPKVAR